MRQVTVEYHGQKEFNKDRPERLKNGWRIVSVSEVKQPVGLARIATITVGALVIKPKPHIFVVYERADDVQRPVQTTAGGIRPAQTTAGSILSVQAQDPRNELVNRQARLRSTEDQLHRLWSNIERHIERPANSDDLDREEAERDFMANLGSFLSIARLTNGQRQWVIQATPLDIVGESDRLRTLIADGIKRIEKVQELALVQERVITALRDKVLEADLRAVLTERDDLAKQLRPPSATGDSAVAALPSPSVSEAVPHSLHPEETSPAALDLLRKLAELHEAGILSDAEFAAKKAELLSRL